MIIYWIMGCFYFFQTKPYVAIFKKEISNYLPGSRVQQ
jgi:hypothetical protein